MKRFESRHGVIVLTDEREHHIFEFHPDIRGYLKYFASTLTNPEIEMVSIHDPTVVICYRLLPTRKRYLAIVIKTGPRPFVVTVYLARKPK